MRHLFLLTIAILSIAGDLHSPGRTQTRGQSEAQNAIDHANDRYCRVNPGNCSGLPNAVKLKGTMSTSEAYRLCDAGYGTGRSAGFISCVEYLKKPDF
jgi:hypothetical protein